MKRLVRGEKLWLTIGQVENIINSWFGLNLAR